MRPGDIDPDVLKALRTISEARRSKTVGDVRKRQSERDQAKFETQIELLVDEVEKVCDPKNPAFLLILMLAVMEKVKRQKAEPEFRSYLEFPNDF
jgi:hypothetical protein